MITDGGGKIFNIGIVGLGNNGLMHMNGFARLPNSRVAAVCDLDAGMRENALSALKDDSVFSTNDYKKLCAMEELDAISICTPTYFHMPIALCALDNGKDLLLEKPIAPTIAEVDKLIERAFDTDRIVQIGLVYRYCNLYRTVGKMVERGDFGNVMMAYCNEFRDNFPTQWFFETAKSGGALLDKDCHHFDLFSWFIRSRPEKVYAMGGQHVVKGKSIKVNCGYAPDQDAMIKKPDIVDHAFVLIEYANKARANLGLCMYEVEPLTGLEVGIMGNNGAHLVAKRDAVLTAGGGPLGEIREIPVDYVNDNHGIGHIGADVQHVEFLRCLQDRKLPYANLLNARESMVIAMAAERSIKEKREVFIEEFSSPAIAKLMKKYSAELSRPTPAPLPPPAQKKEKKPTREKLIVDTFTDLVRLLMGKQPRGAALPFTEETFANMAKRMNADARYRKLTKSLNAVLAFDYPGCPRVTMDIKEGALEVIPERLHVKEDAAIIFTEKGWENIQAGDSPYKLFLTGQMRIAGDVNKLSPYADAFVGIGKFLAEG
ncbi:MAG: Gfo/Idh/MocA family oxidoreductase [bacterium]